MAGWLQASRQQIRFALSDAEAELITTATKHDK